MTFTYKTNKKKQVTEQRIKDTIPGGNVYYARRVFTRWKKSNRDVRNCDAFGTPVITPYSYE